MKEEQAVGIHNTIAAYTIQYAERIEAAEDKDIPAILQEYEESMTPQILKCVEIATAEITDVQLRNAEYAEAHYVDAHTTIEEAMNMSRMVIKGCLYNRMKRGVPKKVDLREEARIRMASMPPEQLNELLGKFRKNMLGERDE